MAIDWNLVGTGLMGLLTGVGGWFMGKGKRAVESAEATAERDVVNLLRQEVQRLSDRLTLMEAREGRTIRHIYRLEGLMRAAGIEPPHFEIDGGSVEAES